MISSRIGVVTCEKGSAIYGLLISRKKKKKKKMKDKLFFFLVGKKMKDKLLLCWLKDKL